MSQLTDLLKEYTENKILNVFDENKYSKNIVQRGFVIPDSELPTSYVGPLGTKVVSDVTLVGGTYYDPLLNTNITFKTLTYPAVIMMATKAHKIIQTEIQGRDGTVKEYIGQDDTHITIEGIITGPNGVYPRDAVADLDAWHRAPITKGIVGNFISNLGITNVVSTDCVFMQEEGGYSYQKFTLNLISDVPVELKLSLGA